MSYFPRYSHSESKIEGELDFPNNGTKCNLKTQQVLIHRDLLKNTSH